MDEIHEQSFGKNDGNENQKNSLLDSTKNNNIQNDINKPDFDIISKQNKNYQNQILLLTQRIKEYEKDCVKKNSREENQIKEFMLLETNLKIKINEKDEIISSLESENNFLKEQLNNMENNFEQLKNEVKKLILIKTEQKNIENNINSNNINPKETTNLNINQSNELLELIQKYSIEISKLKKQNEILTNTLQSQNQSINNINNPNNNLINSQNIKDSIINNYANEINKEMYIISRWIDTYLVCEFNKDFEVPSLINEENDIENAPMKLNLVNFKILKKSLDNAIQNLNNIINSKETEIIEIRNLLSEKEFKFNELKKELSLTKKNLYELRNDNEGLIQQLEQSKKDFQYNMDAFNKIKLSANKDKENQILYLSNIYTIINKQINTVLQDINFKAYHEKFLSTRHKNESVLINKNINIEEMFLTSFNKLMEFLDELKFDYLLIKKENLNIMKEKAVDNLKILKNENEQNINQNEIEEYKQRIEQLLNDNNLLKEQIEINNKKNQIKEINENNNLIKVEDLQKQINDLKENNNDLQQKLKNINEGNFELEKKNNTLENEVEKLKAYENLLQELKEKYDNLTFDYQRIQKENNSLKLVLNNQ